MPPKHAAEVVTIRKAAIRGDLLDAAIGEGEQLRGVPGSCLLHVDRRCGAGVLLEPANEDAFAHQGPPGQVGIGEIAGQLAVQEAQDLVEPFRLLGGDGNLQVGETGVQEGAGTVVEVLPGERTIGGLPRAAQFVCQRPKDGGRPNAHRPPWKGARFLQGIEVQPEVRRSRFANAIEKRHIRNEQQLIRSQRKGFPSKEHVATRRTIVVQPPKGTEHLRIIPLRAIRMISALVNDKRCETQPRRVTEPQSMPGERGLITTFETLAGHRPKYPRPLVHGKQEVQIRYRRKDLGPSAGTANPAVAVQRGAKWKISLPLRSPGSWLVVPGALFLQD